MAKQIHTSKDVRRYIEVAKGAGWTVELSNGGHVRFKSPAGPMVIVSQSGAMRGPGLRNVRADLRRAGLAV